MIKFLSKASSSWLLLGLLAASAVCSLLGPEFSGHLRGAANYVLTPFGDAGMYLTTSLKKRASRIGRPAVSPDEAARLAEANEQLRRRINAVEEELVRYLRRDMTLDRLYGPIPYAQWQLIPARVVGGDALPYGKTRVVNAGSSRGVAAGAQVTTRVLSTDRSKALPEGMAAVSQLPAELANISPAALVGRIARTSAHTARCRLITDRNFRINARIRRVIDRDNPRTITVRSGDAMEATLTELNNMPIDVAAVGDGRGGMIVSDVYAYDNVREGDWLVTAGGDAFLPAEIQIGKVAAVEHDPERRGLFVSLTIVPSADLEVVRDVYIVLPVALAADQAQKGGPQ